MKVQRPGVKESIALDIYILRSLAVVIRRVRKINSDLGEILDEASPSLQLCCKQPAVLGVPITWINLRCEHLDVDGLHDHCIAYSDWHTKHDAF